ncbi:hypothetical protein GCM10028857_26190 [Salinarchaeum chitinilyticum]
MPDPQDLMPLESTSYEKLVAGLSVEVDEVDVEHQCDYALETGGEKEVDVMIWDRRSEEEEKILVECKYHGSNLNQGYVDEMVGLLCQSDVDRAILITKTGFQSGALERARSLQDTDMRVDLFELRLYDEEEDFETTINSITTTINIPSPDVNIEEAVVSPVTEAAEDHEMEFQLSMFQSPEVVTLDGEPTGEMLFPRWISQVESTYSEHLEPSFQEENSSSFTDTAEFDDTYIAEGDAIFEIESIDYELVIDWVPVLESETTLEDVVFDRFDMVLIDALDQRRDYINSENALEAFLAASS